jgi:hypothetical protein
MLLEESRRLEELSEHNQRLFNRMLPAESRALGPMSPRVREATTPLSKYRNAGTRGDDDARDFAAYAPSLTSSSASGRYPRIPGVGDGLSAAKMHVDDLAPQTVLSSASSSRRPTHPHDSSYEEARVPQMYEAEQPRLPLHDIAERSVPVDVQAEMKVNAFLQSFHPADRLLTGIHLRLLFSYYKAQPDGEVRGRVPARTCSWEGEERSVWRQR